MNFVFVLLTKITRMHSSRMRTGRSLAVCCSLLTEGVSAPGGAGGVCSGGCLLRGVCSQGCIPACPPSPVDRILDTHLWKYYLGPTLLRRVTITARSRYEEISPFYGANETPVLGLWWYLPYVSKPTCNLFLRFTSGATLADLLAAGMVAGPLVILTLTLWKYSSLKVV